MSTNEDQGVRWASPINGSSRKTNPMTATIQIPFGIDFCGVLIGRVLRI